jgi:predicted nucleic acid-binding protein
VRIAFDTNVLAYAEGVNGVERRDAALAIIRKLPQDAGVVPIQVLGELFNVLVRKAGKSRSNARDALLSWRDTFSVVETSPEVMLGAADLATDHQLGIWDAVILSASALGGCRLLLSEDLQEGFTWAGVTVVNPFASPQHALLQALLKDDAK